MSPIDPTPQADPLSHSVVLHLQWVAEVSAQQAELGAIAFVDTLRHLDVPLDVAFRLVSHQGQLNAALVVGGVDETSARRAGVEILDVAAACLPWYGFEKADDPVQSLFSLPADPLWVSRIRGGDEDPPRVQMGSGSAVACVLSTEDMVVSASVGVSFAEWDPEPSTDLIVASNTAPTDTVGALLALEIGGSAQIEVAHATGYVASLLMSTLGLGTNRGLPDTGLARLLTLPVRTEAEAGWRRLPVPPTEAGHLMDVVQSNPEMHRWIIGRTGTGKSTLIEHLILRDANEGKTLLVLDPHGDLAQRVISLLPADRAGDVEYLDFGRSEPPSLNPLAPEPGQDSDAVVAELGELIHNLFPDRSGEWFGPIFYRMMNWALRLVVEGSETPSLDQVLKVLSGDEEEILRLCEHAGDPDLERMWNREMKGQLGTGKDSNATTYVASKLDPLVSDSRLRRVFLPAEDQTGHAFSVADAVGAGRIIVVQVPVGELGMVATRTLATALIQRATGALGRRHSSGTPSQPLAIYVDEWHRVAEAAVVRLLAEGRKYGFELTLANQSVGQLDDPATVAANVGTLVAFRVGPVEATLFASEYATVSADGLRMLPPHWAAVRSADGDEIIAPTPPPAAPRSNVVLSEPRLVEASAVTTSHPEAPTHPADTTRGNSPVVNRTGRSKRKTEAE